MIGHISADGTTSTMFRPLARDASRPGSPLANADNMSFLPLTLLDLANQLFAATGQKEKKGKRPGAAGEC